MINDLATAKTSCGGESHPMSFASVVHKLAPPKLLVAGLPTFRQSFTAPCLDSNGLAWHSGAAARYVGWRSLFAQANLAPSFRELFISGSAHSTRHLQGPPRLVFFGEQHHQPSVLHAQLQLISLLHQMSQEATDLSSSRRRYKLHLIMEHFSILDQGLLNDFAENRINAQGFAQAYQEGSDEGFAAIHYLPLLALAKELNVPVWGGFPPRRWAKLVNKYGIEAAKAAEEERSNAGNATGLRVPRFTAWDSVVSLSAAHQSYLSTLRWPDRPPLFPPVNHSCLERDSLLPTRNGVLCSATYPTWLIPRPTPETRGFGPAQALKDAYLAHVTSWILRQPVLGEEIIVLVICGLGHCEYGFGAPERVLQYLRNSKFTPEDLRQIRPFIIASKAIDSGIWLRNESDRGRPDLSDSASIIHTTSCNSELTDDWSCDPWTRKVADAIVLYEWFDPSQQALDHQATETEAAAPAPAPATASVAQR